MWGTCDAKKEKEKGNKIGAVKSLHDDTVQCRNIAGPLASNLKRMLGESPVVALSVCEVRSLLVGVWLEERFEDLT